MSTTSGPENLPIPQPSDAPDGPGAFLALVQKLVVGGAIPYDTYANMTAGLGTGYNGQLSVVYNDTTKSGLYWSNGSSWSLIIGPRLTATLTPGSGYTIGSGQVTLRGTSVTISQQVTKATSMAAGDIIFVLPAGYRPPGSGVTVVLAGASTNSGAANPATLQVNANGNVSINSVGASVTALWVSGTFENF